MPLPPSLRPDLAIEIFGHGAEDERPNEAEPPPDLVHAEARFVATELRHILHETESWGAVRVVPASGDGFEVIVSGTLRHSGSSLVLEIEGRDAAGRRLSPVTYHEADAASRSDFLGRIGSDLLAWRREAGSENAAALRLAAQLRFGVRLAPEVFARYREPQEGPAGLARPPDLEPPVKQRLEQVWERDRTYLAILNDHYQALHDALAGPYEDWRTERTERTGNSAPQAALRGLWRSFDAPGPPSRIELEGQSKQLQGSVEDQFLVWRAFARRILLSPVEAAGPGPGHP